MNKTIVLWETEGTMAQWTRNFTDPAKAYEAAEAEILEMDPEWDGKWEEANERECKTTYFCDGADLEVRVIEL